MPFGGACAGRVDFFFPDVWAFAPTAIVNIIKRVTNVIRARSTRKVLFMPITLRFIRNKISRHEFDRVLGKPQNWDRIETRVNDTFYYSLFLYIVANKAGRHDGTAKWDHLRSAFCDLPAAGVDQLSLDRSFSFRHRRQVYTCFNGMTTRYFSLHAFLATKLQI